MECEKVAKVICPVCGKPGALHAYYQKVKSGKVGPYFRVMHYNRETRKYVTHSIKRNVAAELMSIFHLEPSYYKTIGKTGWTQEILMYITDNH